MLPVSTVMLLVLYSWVNNQEENLNVGVGEIPSANSLHINPLVNSHNLSHILVLYLKDESHFEYCIPGRFPHLQRENWQYGHSTFPSLVKSSAVSFVEQGDEETGLHSITLESAPTHAVLRQPTNKFPSKFSLQCKLLP